MTRRFPLARAWYLSTTVFASIALVPAAACEQNPILKTFEYDGQDTFRGAYGNMDFTIDAIGPPDLRGPRLRVAIQGKPAFKLQLKGESGNASAIVKVLRLDGDLPQILFQHFTFGAHCCTSSKIATRVDGHWVVVRSDDIDGEVGYTFKDFEGTGVSELVSFDQSFLYAFTGYSSSYAPIMVQKLEGAQLVNVTHDPRFRKAVRLSLVELEEPGDPDKWHQNGFLAAWIATKALLGEGPQAWARMLKSYDAHSDWPMDFKTFPESLRALLLKNKYIPDVSAYPLLSSPSQ